jgi:hypothetical protein
MAKPAPSKTCNKCEKYKEALTEIERLAKLGEGHVWYHILKLTRDALK